MKNKIYENITTFMNENSSIQIYFEKSDSLAYSIYDYPAFKLLRIDNMEEFIKEAYYKILDRPIDEKDLKHLQNNLRNNVIAKQNFLKSLESTKEAIVKNTKLNWEKQ